MCQDRYIPICHFKIKFDYIIKFAVIIIFLLPFISHFHEKIILFLFLIFIDVRLCSYAGMFAGSLRGCKDRK